MLLDSTICRKIQSKVYWDGTKVSVTRLLLNEEDAKKLAPVCYRNLLQSVATNNMQRPFVIAADGQKLSIRIVRRYLHKSGIRSYVSTGKPYLSEKRGAVRLQWCRWGLAGLHSNGKTLHRLISRHSHLVQLRITHVYGEKLGRVTKLRIWCLLSNPVMHRCVYGECFLFMGAVPQCGLMEIWIKISTSIFYNNTYYHSRLQNILLMLHLRTSTMGAERTVLRKCDCIWKTWCRCASVARSKS